MLVAHTPVAVVSVGGAPRHCEGYKRTVSTTDTSSWSWPKWSVVAWGSAEPVVSLTAHVDVYLIISRTHPSRLPRTKTFVPCIGAAAAHKTLAINRPFHHVCVCVCVSACLCVWWLLLDDGNGGGKSE